MGKEDNDIFMSFELSDEEAKNYETVRNKFEEKFVVKKLIYFNEPSSIPEYKSKMRLVFTGEVIDAINATAGELKTILQVN